MTGLIFFINSDFVNISASEHMKMLLTWIIYNTVLILIFVFCHLIRVRKGQQWFMHAAVQNTKKCACKMVPIDLFWILLMWQSYIPACVRVCVFVVEIFFWGGGLGGGLFWLKLLFPDILRQHGLKDAELIQRRFVKSVCLNQDILLPRSSSSAPPSD